MSQPRILVVEDEKNLRDAVRLNLEMEGYEVVTASDGRKAVNTFRQQHFDLIVLDIMLPELNGLEVCEQIRLEDEQVPVLFLTARDTTSDIVTGLKQGGDDYMTKPFNLEEFLLRVRNLLRRSRKAPMEETELHEFRFGDNYVNFQTYEAHGPRGTRQLTKKEAKLLKLFFLHPGEVVSRKEILRQVWGYDVFPTTRTIDNFILSFRKYFEPDPHHPKYFQSVRGIGYRFTLDDY